MRVPPLTRHHLSWWSFNFSLSLVSLRCDRSLRGCMGYLLIFANLTGGDITINASEKNEYR
jgi:hypothetical protein